MAPSARPTPETAGTPIPAAGPVSAATARPRPEGGSRIEDEAEASQIHQRGGYGTPERGGALALDPLETAYLVEMQRLRVLLPGAGPASLQELLSDAHRLDPTFEIRFLVYRDLRQRGYVVLRGLPPSDFSVLPRGGSPAKTPSKWWVDARSERTPFSLPEMVDHLGRAHGARRTLLLGIVDEESDLTFYRVRSVEPQGERTLPDPGGSGATAEGVLLEDRVSVYDPASVAQLGGAEHYGSRVGPRLELSLLEAVALVRAGRLVLRKGHGEGTVSPSDAEAAALRKEPDLMQRLPVYQHLRAQGLLPKTGFKYGAHFRAYERDPESSHARYLVHVVPAGWAAPWPEVARAVRLAQGVRKSFLLAWLPPGGGAPAYLHLERIRP